MVPLSILIKKKEKKNKQKNKNEKFILTDRTRFRREVSLKKFLFSFLSLRFTEFRPSDFVGSNTKSALRDEGYTWEPKTRDFTENSGKNLKKS